MSFTEAEKLIINLKTLSELTPNAKISTYNTYLSVQQHVPLLTPATRWLYGEKKTKAANKIKEMVNQARILLEQEEDKVILEQIEEALADSLKGIRSLRITYYGTRAASQLAVIEKTICGILKARNVEIPSEIFPAIPNLVRSKQEDRKRSDENDLEDFAN